MLSNEKRYHQDLDALASLACQSFNFGNQENWFYNFRSGMQGFHSRISIVRAHGRMIFDWVPGTGFHNLEPNMAICLFAMDSAVECFIYALNAFGHGVAKNSFRDVGDQKQLKRISLDDIMGPSPLAGYTQLFPLVREHFLRHEQMIRLIQDNHDITKHPHQGFTGSTSRSDAPPGFFKSIGMSESDPHRWHHAPFQTVLLSRYPKLPIEERPSDLTDTVGLEELIRDFGPFVLGCLERAFTDASSHVKLNPWPPKSTP